MLALALVLKDEIRRLARKEIKAQTSCTAKAVARYRREIAALKRQLGEQGRTLSSLQKQNGKVANANVNGSEDSTRFSARSAKAQRRRTGLSAADYAKLVGVSPLTIYNWEHGKSRPRAEQFKSLVALRGVGKRQAVAKLDEISRLTRSKSTPRQRKPR